MHLFYAPNISSEKEYTLNEEESKHAIRVLRLKKDDIITLIDGKGTFFEAKISDTHPKKCMVNIISSKFEKPATPYLHIAIAPTKNNDRLEWFTEKCTEIGINEISTIICAHSERKKLKEERIIKTAISAMKQSLKATLPTINTLNSFQNFIQLPFNGKKYIAHCYENKQQHLKNLYNKGENALILIGPEGDFSKEEIEIALQNGFEPITLGTSRLRTETAGIVACNTINLLNE